VVSERSPLGELVISAAFFLFSMASLYACVYNEDEKYASFICVSSIIIPVFLLSRSLEDRESTRKINSKLSAFFRQYITEKCVISSTDEEKMSNKSIGAAIRIRTSSPVSINQIDKIDLMPEPQKKSISIPVDVYIPLHNLQKQFTFLNDIKDRKKAIIKSDELSNFDEIVRQYARSYRNPTQASIELMMGSVIEMKKIRRKLILRLEKLSTLASQVQLLTAIQDKVNYLVKRYPSLEDEDLTKTFRNDLSDRLSELSYSRNLPGLV